MTYAPDRDRVVNDLWDGAAAMPAYRSWADRPGTRPGLWSYLTHQVGVTGTVAVATLLWPQFLEVDGCILLAEHYRPELHRHWHHHLGGDRARVEAITNQLHLWDIFSGSGEEQITDQLLSAFGTTMADSWNHALQQQHPGTGTVAHYTWDDEADGPVITAHAPLAGAAEDLATLQA